MAFFRCDVMSESLGMATSVLVTMPDTGNLAAAPVVYLLHGLTDNCTGWLRYTQAEHLARTHGAILIVPEVQRSFYTDMACGPSISPTLIRNCQRSAAGFSAFSPYRSALILWGFRWADTVL